MVKRQDEAVLGGGVEEGGGDGQGVDTVCTRGGGSKDAGLGKIW